MTTAEITAIAEAAQRKYGAWAAEVVRNLAYAVCTHCQKLYLEGPCDLIDHLEGYEALLAAKRAAEG